MVLVRDPISHEKFDGLASKFEQILITEAPDLVYTLRSGDIGIIQVRDLLENYGFLNKILISFGYIVVGSVDAPDAHNQKQNVSISMDTPFVSRGKFTDL